jgi:RES domain-containing protein
LSHTVWRIATDTPTHTADDLSGAGAKATGGRWNEPGIPVVYASETQALACLETLVHLNAGGLPLNRYLVAITIPASLWATAHTETVASLPVGWDAEPAGLISIRFGTKWLNAAHQAVLRVPSAIVPDECNVLVNPRHPESQRIKATKLRRFLYDPRSVKRNSSP